MRHLLRTFTGPGLIAASLLAAAPARAHEFWLAASAYTATPGRAVDVGALSGTGFRGERKPFSRDRCVRFAGRSAVALDLGRASRNGDLAWVRFVPADGGGFLAGYESTFTPIELPGPDFDAYLTSEGLDGPRAARRDAPDRPGRERYRRCPKVWLAGTDEARATKPMKLQLEIVPLARPGADASLRIRLLWSGKPLANALVKAWRNDVGSSGVPMNPEARDSVAVAWSGRTDQRGEATVPVAARGEWMLSSVHMEPCRDRAVADWESTWASLTFARLP